MSDFRQFSEESIRKIQRDHSRLKALSESISAQQQVERRESDVVRTVTGYTSTNAANPTYPTTGDTYVVKLKDYYFQEQAGTRARTATGDFSKSIIARTWDGSKLDENTPVICDLIHCVGRGYRWWIRPIPAAGATPLRWTQMVSATTAGSWHFWQDGAGSRDTDGTIEITTGGVFAFPRFGIGTYSNSVGTAFALTTTPTTYNQKCITFTQKAFYSLHVTLSWGLPPLTSSQFNSDYREAAHDHTYDDGGTTKTTDQTTIDSPRKDSRQPVTVVTEVNGVELGRSSLQNFYTADGDPDMYATHSSYMQLDRSSSLTGIDIRFRRLYNEPTLQTAVPYVVRASVRLEQISDNL
jgi:hypothetical protein